MIYRVVQRGKKYQAQYRFMFLWWCDSIHRSYGNLEDAIEFAKCATDKPQKVVWP